MTDHRFDEVAQALGDFFDGINRAKDAVAVLKTLMRHDAFLMPQYLRDAEAALNDAANAVDFEPCDDEFDDEDEEVYMPRNTDIEESFDGEELEANYGATTMHNSCDDE